MATRGDKRLPVRKLEKEKLRGKRISRVESQEAAAGDESYRRRRPYPT